jgi:hypothetical protein
MTQPQRTPRVGDYDFIFTSFPELPVEIQLKIWKYGIPPARIIKIKAFAAGTIYDYEYARPLAESFSRFTQFLLNPKD